MIFVDSGAFVAWYVKNDRGHKSASTVWDQLRLARTPLVTSSLVISESLTLIGRRAGYGFAAERGRGLFASRFLEILRHGENDEIEALRHFEKFADQEVSFTDCVSFALMRSRGIRRAFTFDRHFDLLDFERFPLA